MKTEQRQLTRDEYLAEMAKVYGPRARDWKCECPICHRVYSLGECGTTSEEAERGLFGCIGRINGKGYKAFSDKAEAITNEHGCNFAANGLFRSPWLFYEKTVGEGDAVGIMPIAPPDPQPPK